MLRKQYDINDFKGSCVRTVGFAAEDLQVSLPYQVENNCVLHITLCYVVDLYLI